MVVYGYLYFVLVGVMAVCPGGGGVWLPVLEVVMAVSLGGGVLYGYLY